MKRPKKWRPLAVLAVDPGESAGIAYVVGGEVIASGPGIGSRWTTLSTAVRALLAQIDHSLVLPAMEDTLGVIEAGWVKGRGMKSGLTLAQRRGIAQAAMESVGVSYFEFIGPTVWMNAFYGSIHKQDTKALAMKFAAEFSPVNDDVADAINLARYAYKEFCLP